MSSSAAAASVVFFSWTCRWKYNAIEFWILRNSYLEESCRYFSFGILQVLLLTWSPSSLLLELLWARESRSCKCHCQWRFVIRNCNHNCHDNHQDNCDDNQYDNRNNCDDLKRGNPPSQPPLLHIWPLLTCCLECFHFFQIFHLSICILISLHWPVTSQVPQPLLLVLLTYKSVGEPDKTLAHLSRAALTF